MNIRMSIAWVIAFVGLGMPVDKARVIKYYREFVPERSALVEKELQGLSETIRPSDLVKNYHLTWVPGLPKGKYRKLARMRWAQVG